MIAVLVSGLAATALLIVFGLGMVHAGLRAGDRPGDAVVTALLGAAGQPDEPRPVAVATVRNPGALPLVAGFSVRRRLVPGWLGGGMTVRVPRRTMRRRFRAAAHAVVGVIPPASEAEFAVPVTRIARAYLLTAVVGQSGGRLRVFRVPVTGRCRPGPAGAARACLSLDDDRLS